jgi:hypothetical protein
MLPSDIVVRMPTIDGDGITNGGLMSSVICPSDSVENIFPAVFFEEALVGKTRVRKRFYHLKTADSQKLARVRVFMDKFSDGDDRVYIFPASQEDAQGDLTGTERMYGCGLLDANVIAGATTITVAVEKASDNILRTGDQIRLFNGITRDLGVISNITWNADVATIILTFPLNNAYSRTDTIVSSYFEQTLVRSYFDAFTVLSLNGTYNINNYPILLINESTIFQRWTLTFSNPSQYQCVGQRIGSVGTGNIATDFAPLNPDYNRAYFILPSGGFNQSFQQGDQISFVTHPSSVPIWYKQIIPPNTQGVGGNKFKARIEGVPA